MMQWASGAVHQVEKNKTWHAFAIVRRTGRSKGGADALRGSAELGTANLMGAGTAESRSDGGRSPSLTASRSCRQRGVQRGHAPMAR